jgi:hypothetical protein
MLRLPVSFFHSNLATRQSLDILVSRLSLETRVRRLCLPSTQSDKLNLKF